MKKLFYSMKLAKSIILLILLGAVTSCAEKDLYNNDENDRKSKLPSEDSYFGFEMKGELALDVNYGVSGFVANVEVYSQKPVDERNVKIEGIKPIYSAFINDGKLSAKMDIPFVVKEAWLYTERIGLPRCVQLQVSSNGFSYDATKTTGVRAVTRAVAAGVLTEQVPYLLAPQGRNDNMYSLCTWNSNGRPMQSDYLIKTSYDMNGLTSRVQNYLTENAKVNGGKNENLRRDAKDLNIVIPQGGSKIEVTFLSEAGAFDNVFGYYYYKDQEPKTRADYFNMRKYVIFPNVINESRALKCGDTAKLLFFGENGDVPTETFPEGYVVGWFLLSNGAPYASDNGINIKKIDQLYTDVTNEITRNICFSNEMDDQRQFITLYDKASKLFVVGVEDEFGRSQGDNDFDDVLFCVKTTPEMSAGNLPEIPDGNPEVKPETETVEGTLAFEDNWPNAGDYDMNDVIIEYKRMITYDQHNNAKQIEESFTSVQRDNAATFENIFAYQIENLGAVTLPEGCEIENSSRSIVITKSVRDIKKKTFKVVRSFSSSINKDEIKSDFNPYILVKGIRETNKGRAEVHLPKHSPTELADRAKLYTNNDAYYVDKDGKYPFAVDIPIIGFVPADERKRIDEEGQYVSFRSWVSSSGTKDTDWYMKK
ncbi:LruC domain-containing protein [Bacteroides sp.]|uniref:LruC domain-containing protein n=1 Tax=Bacteroides sp. TaxID=29523 RepID=UPI00262DF13B|nr:LruC domain-containing protein [Bacteroides sp.]MDD3037736.1 LruC domain-containing protein [Bacteroides sp.]